jgi:hypothetical protein
MLTSDGKKRERAMTGEGVEEVNRDRGKRSADFTEKNFVRLLIFFRLLFLLNLPVPDETPAAKFRSESRPYEVLVRHMSRNAVSFKSLYRTRAIPPCSCAHPAHSRVRYSPKTSQELLHA